jgi:hypothetical protein
LGLRLVAWGSCYRWFSVGLSRHAVFDSSKNRSKMSNNRRPILSSNDDVITMACYKAKSA